LTAWLAVTGDRLTILADDRGAAYPVLIDPLMTNPAWSAESNQASAGFGTSVATAGDVNGDGYSDVIVGAPTYDNGQADEGKVFVYHGSPSGLSTTPSWSFEGNFAGVQLGNAVASAGDINGDGFGDVILAAYLFDDVQTDEGRVFVFQGTAAGLPANPAWTMQINQSGAQFGRSVGTAGDVNGDGFSDVLIGAPLYDNGQINEGRAYVFHGTAGGLGINPQWVVESNQDLADFGLAVSTAGDVNGDGYSDVIVGAPFYELGVHTNEGRAFVYLGSGSGLSTTSSWIADPNQANAELGTSVSTAGDVNGDGYADVIVGAWRYDNGSTDEGRAFAYYGSGTGLSLTPNWTAESDQAGAEFGVSVAMAGDVSGDGYADVIIGAHKLTNSHTLQGRAYVYQGSATGLAATPLWTAQPSQNTTEFGVSVATAGDVNGDGYSDVIVGAPLFENGLVDEGSAFVWHGSPASLAAGESWSAEGNQVNCAYGAEIAGAGDVNGDGYSEVMVGAFAFDNGEQDEGRVFVYDGSPIGTLPFSWTVEGNQAGARFGDVVAPAGDVNGDGYADILVGVPFYDSGQIDEGAVFLYLGSATGLVLPAAWMFQSNQAHGRLGGSVATAGDVNGDGLSDVIIGWNGYSNGQGTEGRALVFHGSFAGLSQTPSWTVESNQVLANLGASVASAGDVNGDGFSDVIVGAIGYDNDLSNEGRAFVFLGSPTGLEPVASWQVDGNQAEWHYDNGSDDEGAAFVFHGSAGGLSLLPAWVGEGNQANAIYGIAAGTAGDVNGDGYSDLIVGAPEYDNPLPSMGRAFVYHGSASGLAISAVWTAESAENSRFGTSVTTAGDVNGDGFSDVIVGATLFANDQGQEGKAFVYLGNDGDGLDPAPRQRHNTFEPIAPLGRSSNPDGFLLVAECGSPGGRGQVRMQAEVKPAGVPFDGTGLVTGSFLDSGAPGAGGSSRTVAMVVSGLDPDQLYHWRLRVLTNSPFAPRSRWLWLPDNAVTEADLRTATDLQAVADTQAPASHAGLSPAIPNPFSSSTQLVYEMPRKGRVHVAVYDVQGRRVAELADGTRPAGRHAARWDGRDTEGAELAPGVYFVRLESEGRIATQKLVLMP
jgi:hypothetical protein